MRALIAIQWRLANDMTHAVDETDMSGDKGLCVEAVRRFEHNTGGIDWYCEQRGEGPPVVLVPSGEGDCASFEGVAAHLANDFTVLAFDMPGFSRSTFEVQMMFLYRNSLIKLPTSSSI